ncbi:hypothetical protein BASA81_010066 [Batrachochytrium salamandrivorans]|nr:hypothetical protein BASA81_010066 [Batrachochytrium salamandrivorans]
MDNVEEEARKLSRVMVTVSKMLRARGYKLPAAEFSTWQELKRMFDEGKKKSDLFFRAERPSPGEGGEPGIEYIVVLFSDEPKVQSKDARGCMDRMARSSATRAILVADEPLTTSVRAVLTLQPKVRIEPFLTAELIIDITEHELVPDHVVLTEDEKKLVLKRYNLNDSQLPRMPTSDPISRYFGLSRGNVVKIIRSSETAGRYVTYRIVMDA